jgi:5'-nucleotidase
VVVVAPVDRRVIGHALTLKRPLRLESISPVLCRRQDADRSEHRGHAGPKRLPDVVLGINKGYNLGDDVTYSGTVAGALEAALLGVPSLAVSLRMTRGTYDFRFAAEAAATLTQAMLRQPLPPRTFLNVNVPKGQPKGFRVTVQASRNHITSVAERHDPKGRPYFWIEEGQDHWHPHDRSDHEAVHQGYVSVTPLQPDLTAHATLAAVEARQD